MNRTAIASLLIVSALAIPLGAWYVAGARDAAREAAAVEGSPMQQAREAASRLADKLATRLESLRDNESRRPFYHYQNLYNDPEGAAEGQFVVPSPLADGPADSLVRAHFQVNAAGRLTLPTLNLEIPGRNRPETLAGQRGILEELSPNGMAFVRAVREAYATTTIAKVPKPAAPNAAPAAAASVPALPNPPPKPGPSDGQSTPAVPQAPVLASSSPGLPAKEVPPAGNVPPPKDNAFAPSAAPSSSALSQKQQEPQIQRIDRQSYDNTQSANQLYQELSQRKGSRGQSNKDPQWDARLQAYLSQGGQKPPAQQAASPPGQGVPSSAGTVQLPASPSAQPPPPGAAQADRPASPVQAPAVGMPAQAAAPSQSSPSPVAQEVEIRTSPLMWRTVPVRGVPSLVSLREVTTPDGLLVQGFEVSRPAVEEWMKGPSLPARFLPGAPEGEAEARVPIEGAAWRVAVDPAAAAVDARDRARRIRSGFLRTFLAGAAAAVLAGFLAVGLVWQSERLARQRSRFAASAAHELRTPLAGLRMYGEMLAEGLGDPARSKDYARRVADEAERLGRVVSNVLGFSRLERGALVVRPEPGDLAAAVREGIERQRPALEALGARIALAVADGLPAVRFDRDAVAQILQNLLDNAEKYTRGAADRTIRVEVSRVGGGFSPRPSGPAVCIAVSDRGPGVPAGARSRLFQPFARGGGPDVPAGLGLGLAIARALARAQGGDLAHADAAGGGAIFTVTLPV